MQKKNIFNKKEEIKFDDDIFGQIGDELDDDSSFDMSIPDTDTKPKYQPMQQLQKSNAPQQSR